MSGRERVFLLLVALTVRLALYPWVDGFIWPDEIFQTLEPGSVRATGHGLLSWEWDTGIRSWAVPGIYAALFRVADLLGCDGPGQVVRLAQLVHIGLSLVIVDASMRLAGVIAGARVARWAGIAAAVCAPLVYFAPHPLADCGATAFMAWGLARWVEATAEGAPKGRDAVIAGLLFGVAFAIRYSIPIFFVGPVLVVLWQRRWKPVVHLAAGFLAVALAVGLLDWATWGRPFHSLVGYVKFNLIEGGAAAFGVSPPGWYLAEIARALGWAWPLVALLALRGAVGARGIGLGVALGLALISSAAHKEERFALPVYAFLPLLATLGAWHLGAVIRQRQPKAIRRIARRRVAIVAFAVALLSSSSWIVYAQRDWSPGADWLPAMRWLGARDDVSGILAIAAWPELGGHSMHRLPVPVIASTSLLTDEAERPVLDNLMFNYAVVDAAKASLVSRASPDHPFVVVARMGRIWILRRDRADPSPR